MQNSKNRIKTGKIDLQRIVVISVTVLLAVVFSIASKSFRKYSTLVTLLDSFYYFMFMAIGVTFCLISGGNDLSVGTGMACYALIGGYCVVYLGMPTWVGMLISIVCGFAIGCLNGFLVAIMKLPPFIATLCTMLMTRGLGSVACKGSSVTWPAKEAANGWFRKIFKIFVLNAEGKKTPIPMGIIPVLIALIVMSIILKKTRTGRYIIAIGSNKEAARLSGVNIVKYEMLAYIISGIFTGIAGIAYVCASTSSITPGSGTGLELDAIGGAIIGGTSMKGGSGSIFGTFLGVLLLSVLKNGLPTIGLGQEWQNIITGLILVGAIWIDVLRNKKSN